MFDGSGSYILVDNVPPLPPWDPFRWPAVVSVVCGFAHKMLLSDFVIWLALLLAVLLLLHRVLRQLVLRRSVTPPRNVITVCCPGGGVFFWWQIGAMRELLTLYELPPEHVVLSGASAGALAVVLAQCDVDVTAAHKSADRLAEEAGCFSNPLGLCGVWGRLVYAWLDALLPEEAAAHCTGRCRVVVTRCTPLPQAVGIAAFGRRAELIEALMASTHIPFFMDGHPLSRLVPRATDGGLLTWLGLASELETLCPSAVDRAQAVSISHKHDEAFRTACRAHGWSALSLRGTEEFCGFGAAWVQREARLGADGLLAPLAPYRRPRGRSPSYTPGRSAAAPAVAPADKLQRSPSPQPPRRAKSAQRSARAHRSPSRRLV